MYKVGFEAKPVSDKRMCEIVDAALWIKTESHRRGFIYLLCHPDSREALQARVDRVSNMNDLHVIIKGSIRISQRDFNL